MNVRKKGMLGLIGAIAVFATASVCFSNCSSEDDFGEMEEMEFTMASKKMTRAGESGSGGAPTLPRQKTSTIVFFCNPNGHSIPENYENELDSIINNNLTFTNPNFGDNVMSFYTQYITSYEITYRLYKEGVFEKAEILKTKGCSISDVRILGFNLNIRGGYDVYFYTTYPGYNCLGKDEI